MPKINDLSEKQDRELVALLKDGSQEACGELYARFKEWLMYLGLAEKVIMYYYSICSMLHLLIKVQGKMPKALKTLALGKPTNFIFPNLSSNIELLVLNS